VSYQRFIVSSWVAARALASAVCSILICISYWRAKLIILHHRVNRVDVAALKRLRNELDVLVGNRLVAVAGAEESVIAAHQIVLRRIDQLDAADRAGVVDCPCAEPRDARYRPVRSNRDVVVRRQRDRPALAEHVEARTGLQHPIGIGLEIAGTRIRLATVGPLHGDPAGAVDRDVEWPPGNRQRTLFEDIGQRRIDCECPRRRTAPSTCAARKRCSMAR
jgi:hypothetical protein